MQMAEDVIQAKIVFDTRALDRAMSMGGAGGKGAGGGFTEALSKTALAQDAPIWGDIMAGVGGIVLALRAVYDVAKAGFARLVKASPHLQATMALMERTLSITLRPMSDVISMLLRPFIVSWLRIVLPIYKRWREWFGEGRGQEAITLIGEGWEEVKAGLWNLDWSQIKDGALKMWDGVKNLFTSFFADVMKPELDKINDWWTRLKDKLGTTGFWDTIVNAIMWPVEKAFGWAWDKLKEKVQGTVWEKVLDGLKNGFVFMWDWFKLYLSNLGENFWAGPLAPLFAAFETAWEGALQPMMEALRSKLEEEFPVIMGILNKMGQDAEDQEGGIAGFFKAGYDMSKQLTEQMTGEQIPTIQEVADTAEESFGKSGVLGDLQRTDEGLLSNIGYIGQVIMKLNDIPRHVTTVHEIKTIHTEAD